MRNSAQPTRPELRALRAWQRFHVRLTALYAFAVFAVLATLAVAFYEYATHTETEHLRWKLGLLSQTIADRIDGDMIAKVKGPEDADTSDYRALLDHIRTVRKVDPDIDSIYVLLPTEDPDWLIFAIDVAPDGQHAKIGERYDASEVPDLIAGLTGPVVEQEPVADNFGLSLSGYAPVRDHAGNNVAVLGIDVAAVRIDASRAVALRTTLIVAGIAVLLLGLAAIWVGKNVRDPLERMIAATGAITDGRFDGRMKLQRVDEFGVVARHFDTMAAGLEDREFIRETFGRYVSKEVATRLLNDRDSLQLGGEERVVTVLFSDLRGYSTISEHLPPTEVVELLNRYLAEMNEAIDHYDGVVIEFLGDAILAVFGAPSALPDHAAAAVRCALEMRERLAHLNEGWREGQWASVFARLGYDGLGQRIGLHTGRVIAGNIGSRTRTKYAVIGDTVNVAARLEQLNKELGTEILASSDCVEALPADLAARASARGELAVKGREQPVAVFAL